LAPAIKQGSRHLSFVNAYACAERDYDLTAVDRARLNDPASSLLRACCHFHPDPGLGAALQSAIAGHSHVGKGNVMQSGTVKWFNSQKGFGFIQPDAGGTDVFVHITALERANIRDLPDGQKVNFDTAVDRRTGKTSVDKIELAV
jgi:CspA family cold shock protein